MMEQVTLTLFEVHDVYMAICKRCDTAIRVCEDILATTEDEDVRVSMTDEITKQQAKKHGCRLLYCTLQACCEDKARCRP